MTSIFLSYSTTDSAAADGLESCLRSQGLSVWRDKSGLHAGERWPMKLGQAIADSDALVLLWSKAAADSDFVELEWNTALALKKTIVPIILDDHKLPPALSAIQAIRDLDTIAEALSERLSSPSLDGARSASERILNTLDNIDAGASPKAIAKELSARVRQDNWEIAGNVFQAPGGTINIHHGGATGNTRKGLQHWITALGIIASVITILAFALDIPNKLPGWWQELFPPSLSIAGTISSQQGDPLRGIVVSLPEYSLRATSNEYGRFEFTIDKAHGKVTDLVAQHPLYQTSNKMVSIRNQSFNFTMKPK